MNTLYICWGFSMISMKQYDCIIFLSRFKGRRWFGTERMCRGKLENKEGDL